MSRSRFLSGLWVSWTLAATYASVASAQEQVISDPELGDAAPAETGTSAENASGVIEDPELAGVGGKSTTITNLGASSSASSSSESGPPPSELHFTLHERANRDLKQDYPREDIWESTTLLSMDATLRRSESLRFGLGFTARYHFAALAHDLPDVRAERYELDVVPTAGYVDGTLAPGLQVRVGYQPVQLGRFDVFSATNVLSVLDLRDGPATIPGRPEVGQLALLVDYTPVSWLSIRAIYVPFFMPHIMSVIDSDYALFTDRPGNIDTFFANYNSQPSDLKDVFGNTLESELKSRLLRSARERFAMSTVSAFVPEPRLNHPQGAIRATAHALFGELGATFATAYEHLPFFRVSDQALAALASPNGGDEMDPQPVSIEYNRFAVLSADGSFDVGPLQLGFELAYQFHRTQYALGTAYVLDPKDYYTDPLSVPVPGFTDIVQGGARVEFTQSTTWLLAVEAFASYALSVPSTPGRSWMFLESGRWLRGIGGIVGYNTDFGLILQVGATWMTGPTVVFVPRIAYEIIKPLTIEVGAFIIDGQTPPPFVTPVLAIGGVWNSLDHVFAGVRLAL